MCRQAMRGVVVGWILTLGAGACGDFVEAPNADKAEGDGVLGEWVRVGFRDRTYHLHRPPGYDGSENRPLLVVFHGHGMTGEEMEAAADLNDDADRAGFVVAYPDGIENSWGIRCDCTTADFLGVDDVNFARAFVDHLAAEMAIDTDRVYLAGFSEGAQLVHRVVFCGQLPVRAAVSVGATLFRAVERICDPMQPTPFAFIQGSEDPTFPWEGNGEQGTVFSAQGSAAAMASVNGCGPEAMITEREDTADDGTEVVVERYSGCDAGSEVVLFGILGGGHTWPASPLRWPDRLGPVSRELDAGAEILDFFAAHGG